MRTGPLCFHKFNELPALFILVKFGPGELTSKNVRGFDITRALPEFYTTPTSSVEVQIVKPESRRKRPRLIGFLFRPIYSDVMECAGPERFSLLGCRLRQRTESGKVSRQV